MSAYCVQADIERLLSTQGVTNMADHDEDGFNDTSVVQDAIDEATGMIDLFCRGRYSSAGLATSLVIANWATSIAASALCELRGNTIPDSLNRKVTWIVETMLPQIQSGQLNLPGLAFGNDLRPAMSNMAIDRRYARSIVRVTRVNSTNQVKEMSSNDADQPIPYG